jgi:preprotein translocase subunit SecD
MQVALSGHRLRSICISALVLMMIGVVGAEPLTVELISAEAGHDVRTNEPVVNYRMSQSSAKQFAELTQKNVGRKMELRIDGKAVMAPVIREPILGGAGQISGGLTEQDARDIAARLTSGHAKIELEVVE